jgi:hypothetical protein
MTVLAVSLLGFGKDTIKDTGVTKERVWSRAEFLAKMFDKIFIQESAKLRTHDDFLETLDLMVKREIITIDGEMIKYETPNNKPNGLLFLCNLIWPFIDSLWATIVYIYTLFPDKRVSEDKILSKIQWFGESLYEDNIILHYESCSFDIISKSLDYFLSEGIIIKEQNILDDVSICLSDTYQGDEEKLQLIFDEITFFKKLSLIKFTNLKTDIQKTLLGDFPMMANL